MCVSLSPSVTCGAIAVSSTRHLLQLRPLAAPAQPAEIPLDKAIAQMWLVRAPPPSVSQEHSRLHIIS